MTTPRILYWAMWVAALGCAIRRDVHGATFFMLIAVAIRLGQPGATHDR